MGECDCDAASVLEIYPFVHGNEIYLYGPATYGVWVTGSVTWTDDDPAAKGICDCDYDYDAASETDPCGEGNATWTSCAWGSETSSYPKSENPSGLQETVNAASWETVNGVSWSP